MSEKKPEIKSVQIGDAKHALVHPGVRWYLQTRDRCKNGSGVLQEEKYMSALLANCLAPAVQIDDFGEDISGVFDAVQQIETFLGA